MPFVAPSIPLSQMDARQQAEFFAQQGIQAQLKAKEFTPTAWTGFSADPSGDIGYLDFGAIVMLFVSAATTGTSDDVMFTVSGLPESLRPTADRIVNSSGMINNGNAATGEAQVFSRDSVFAGTIHFAILRTDVVANYASPSYNVGWTNSGNKGLNSGWIITYVK